MCEDARSKFSEAETRLKKRDVKFFESVSSLEKTHKKYSDRLKECQKRTTVARNDYLLTLDTTNAHLQKHATKDFPQIMLVSWVLMFSLCVVRGRQSGRTVSTLYHVPGIQKWLFLCLQAMDGEVYDKIRDAYILYAQIEADCANYVKANFEDLREQACLVSISCIYEWPQMLI